MEADWLGLREALESPGTVIVLLDSNTLIFLAQGIITPSMILEALSRKFTLVTCVQVVGELEKLSRDAPRLSVRRSARRALEMIERLEVRVVECPGQKADDALVLASTTLKSSGATVVVATSDRSLRRRSRMAGVPTLYYRESERLLEIDWEPI